MTKVIPYIVDVVGHLQHRTHGPGAGERLESRVARKSCESDKAPLFCQLGEYIPTAPAGGFKAGVMHAAAAGATPKFSKYCGMVQVRDPSHSAIRQVLTVAGCSGRTPCSCS